MKTLILLLLTITSTAQIKVSESKETKIGQVGTFFSLSQKDDFAILTYTDVNYNLLTEVKSVIIPNSDLEDFYNIILKSFEEGVAKKIDLELKYDTLNLTFVKNFGIVSLQFTSTDKATLITGKSSYLTKKQFIKLFGKN